ncbi:hypothetical protein CsSME_00006508 [Camellia sinensis var. sinensis]
MGRYCFLVDTPVALVAFREEYGVPVDVHLELGAEDTNPWGRLDQCPFTVLSIIEGGLCFPVQPLMCEFLRHTGLAPTQYILGHTGDGLNYFLKIRPGKEKLVTDTPYKDMHDDGFFWVLGNYETADVPGWYISKNFGLTSIETLQANYFNPNEAAIRTMLRYRNRDCHDLLGYVPSYRYTAPHRSRVTDFLRAPSPPPNPTLPDEMAKRIRIKNLITATSTELLSISPRAPAAGQTFGTVIALASTAVTYASKESHRAGKRPRSVDPSAELVTELSTDQPAEASKPTPLWYDMTSSNHVPDTQLVKSSVKSMTWVKHLETELGRSKVSLEMANADNARLLGQLGRAEQERDKLKAQLAAEKEARKVVVDEANNLVEATKDIYFKFGWKTACEKLGQGVETEVFASPLPAFLPAYLVPYANKVFNALHEVAEIEAEDHSSQQELGKKEKVAVVDVEAVTEATGDEFADLSPLA